MYSVYSCSGVFLCVCVCFPGNVNVKESGCDNDDDNDEDDDNNVQKWHYILNSKIKQLHLTSFFILFIELYKYTNITNKYLLKIITLK